MPNREPVSRQYRAARAAGGYYPHADRGLIEVLGADRAGWLHNLITNAVKTLSPGDGNYAFATNVKGRTLFDLNLLVLDDRLWLDVDAREVPKAMAHLDRHVITEDVQLKNRSAEFGRITVLGPQLSAFCAAIGLPNAVSMASMQHVLAPIAGQDCRMVRDDLSGFPAVELFVPLPQDAVSAAVRTAGTALGMVEIEPEAFQVLRIEAGRPASVEDIDEEVVPPETGQIERGISYHKGCYLGQEVIERMRSHGILARKLVGLQLDGEVLPGRNAKVLAGGQEAGRITTACWSESLKAVLALAYVKTAHAKPDSAVIAQFNGADVPGRVVTLPIHP